MGSVARPVHPATRFLKPVPLISNRAENHTKALFSSCCCLFFRDVFADAAHPNKDEIRGRHKDTTVCHSSTAPAVCAGEDAELPVSLWEYGHRLLTAPHPMLEIDFRRPVDPKAARAAGAPSFPHNSPYPGSLGSCPMESGTRVRLHSPPSDLQALPTSELFSRFAPVFLPHGPQKP